MRRTKHDKPGLDTQALGASGLYYLRRLESDAQHPVMAVGERQAMLVYSSPHRAQKAASDLGGADIVHEQTPPALFTGLPEGVTHLLLDYDPATGEGWLLGPEDF
ncbi:MAG: hypothetical protein M3511_12165 [Deinococcota bacterium]|nr:hypothetical protein [Deinococcota bacterium]